MHGLSSHERTIQCTESLLHTRANSSRDGQKSPKESSSDIKRHTYTAIALHISFTSGRIDLAESQSRSVVSKCASDRVVPTELGLCMQHVQNTGVCYIKTLNEGCRIRLPCTASESDMSILYSYSVYLQYFF